GTSGGAGTSGGGTAGSSGGGTAGASGTSAGTTCDTACKKADACCKGAAAAGQGDASQCTFQTDCDGVPAADQLTLVSLCNQLLTEEAMLGANAPTGCK
ncbi:MAG TPA: hypothetical protein VK989_05285, partial [Polyangia bacterium]|nr:hypothetical protein [Polyangia bacterium]